MLKSQGIRKAPSELISIQKLFLSEIVLPDQKIAPLELPFYNFVCYTIELFTQFSKTNHEITLNLFIIDYHMRKYSNVNELYRRFIGFLNSWKKNSDHDEAKLFLSFLNKGRNQKRNVKLFLKIRKILLKSINQKILEQINLTHEDAVTIVHTMSLISNQQKRILTKKINEHFITKNVKYVNNAKFNSAIICEFFMGEINDRAQDNQQFNSNLTNKINKILEKQTDQIQEFEQDQNSQQNNSFQQEYYSSPLKMTFRKQPQANKENSGRIEEYTSHEKSLVNLDQCMRQLNILKQRDLQIDNRFRKLHLRGDQNF